MHTLAQTDDDSTTPPPPPGPIPTPEMEQILHERVGMAPSHCKLLVKVMAALQARRTRSGVFAGREGEF